MLTVEARMIGRPGAAPSSWELPLPPERRPLTLRDLIAKVVSAEVAAFVRRQEEQRFNRILTPEQLAQAIERGKIVSGGQDLSQEVEEQSAIQIAWQAFEDGLFLVFVDKRQLHTLDDEVQLQSQSHLTFIRLVALAGG